MARGARWIADAFVHSGVGALLVAGEKLFAAGTRGGLLVLSCEDGTVLARGELPPPVWDGMAAAYGRLYVTTRTGKVLSLGKK